MANRPDMIITNKNQKRMHMIELAMKAVISVMQKETQRHYNTRDYLEHELYVYIRNNWSHRKINKRAEEEFCKPYQKNFQ
jgi:hypothetical protein